MSSLPTVPTAPIYCPCVYHPNGYGVREACQAPDQRMARLTNRTLEQTVYQGPENYQGFYGNAFMMGFPDYNGRVYTKTMPVFDHAVPANSAFGIAPGTPLVLVGTTYSPYFMVLPGPVPK
jgi:hypothetical protein